MKFDCQVCGREGDTKKGGALGLCAMDYQRQRRGQEMTRDPKYVPVGEGAMMSIRLHVGTLRTIEALTDWDNRQRSAPNKAEWLRAAVEEKMARELALLV